MITHHVMIDIETLGTKPGCRILSIGACLFRMDQFEFKLPTVFEAAIESQQGLMDEADPDTIAWWDKQSQEAKDAVFNNPKAVHLVSALIGLNSFIESTKQSPEDKVFVWGNGATFDIPVLEEAARRYDMPVAWTFRDSMCFRTLKELGKQFGITEPEFVGVKHNAVADALHQGTWANKILTMLDIHLP